jgi:hypothetical protein
VLFLTVHELSDYKFNIVPQLQEKQIAPVIGLLKSLVGSVVRTIQ